MSMRSILVLFVGSVLCMTGCADRPELSLNAYGTILGELPFLEDAQAPFPFPIEVLPDGSINDHQNCEFDDFDFM